MGGLWGEEGSGGGGQGLEALRLQVKKKRAAVCHCGCASVCCICVHPVRLLRECVLDLFALVDGLLAKAAASAQCWCLTGAHSLGYVVSLAQEMSS